MPDDYFRNFVIYAKIMECPLLLGESESEIMVFGSSFVDKNDKHVRDIHDRLSCY